MNFWPSATRCGKCGQPLPDATDGHMIDVPDISGTLTVARCANCCDICNPKE